MGYVETQQGHTSPPGIIDHIETQALSFTFLTLGNDDSPMWVLVWITFETSNLVT